MAEKVSNKSELLKTVNKAIWYGEIIKRNNADPHIVQLYKSNKYWIPPLSKYKVLLTYIATICDDAKVHYSNISKLYSIAKSADDIINNGNFKLSLIYLDELRLGLTSH